MQVLIGWRRSRPKGSRHLRVGRESFFWWVGLRNGVQGAWAPESAAPQTASQGAAH